MHEVADHYAVLGLNPSADDVVVHAAWRALLRKHHPDTNPDDPAGIKAREINEAFAILGKPGARAAYDRTRLSRPRSARPLQYGPIQHGPIQHSRAAQGMPYFRPAPRRRISVIRLFGAALLTLSMIPIVGAALLAFPETAPATHDALARLGASSPLAATLVTRLDTLAPDLAGNPAPRSSPGTDSDQREVAISN